MAAGAGSGCLIKAATATGGQKNPLDLPGEISSSPISRILYCKQWLPFILLQHCCYSLAAYPPALPCGIGRAALHHRFTWHFSIQGLPAVCIAATGRGLLPHIFTFSLLALGSYFLWHCLSVLTARPLAGVLPCAVRTFLVARGPAVTRREARQSYTINGRCRASGSLRFQAPALLQKSFQHGKDHQRRCFTWLQGSDLAHIVAVTARENGEARAGY